VGAGGWAGFDGTGAFGGSGIAPAKLGGEDTDTISPATISANIDLFASNMAFSLQVVTRLSRGASVPLRRRRGLEARLKRF
jgi:hypothetical protein